MLVQLRNVSSKTLNLQTIGRIKRNPNRDLSKNKITDKYYIYSNYQQSIKELVTYLPKDEPKLKHSQEELNREKLVQEVINGNEFKTKFQS